MCVTYVYIYIYISVYIYIHVYMHEHMNIEALGSCPGPAFPGHQPRYFETTRVGQRVAAKVTGGTGALTSPMILCAVQS